MKLWFKRSFSPLLNEVVLSASRLKMGTDAHQALRFAENLTLPSVQVIVMKANMNCSHCRGRVSRIISKINGLIDYVVDVRNKEVTVRGLIDSNTRESCKLLKPPEAFKDLNKRGCFPILFRT